MPRVFAAGDARHGSVKRVASAGAGSVAIQLLHRLFAAEQLHPRGRPHEPAVAGGTAASRDRLDCACAEAYAPKLR